MLHTVDEHDTLTAQQLLGHYFFFANIQIVIMETDCQWVFDNTATI